MIDMNIRAAVGAVMKQQPEAAEIIGTGRQPVSAQGLYQAFSAIVKF
jgi:hypothetical protein